MIFLYQIQNKLKLRRLSYFSVRRGGGWVQHSFCTREKVWWILLILITNFTLGLKTCQDLQHFMNVVVLLLLYMLLWNVVLLKFSIKHADPGQISTVNRLFNSVEMRYLSVKILLLKCKLIITTVHRFLIVTMTSKRKSFSCGDCCTFHHKSSLNIAWFVRGKSVSSRIHRDLESLPVYERQFPCLSRCNNNNTNKK